MEILLQKTMDLGIVLIIDNQQYKVKLINKILLHILLTNLGFIKISYVTKITLNTKTVSKLKIFQIIIEQFQYCAHQDIFQIVFLHFRKYM